MTTYFIGSIALIYFQGLLVQGFIVFDLGKPATSLTFQPVDRNRPFKDCLSIVCYGLNWRKPFYLKGFTFLIVF